LKEQIAKYCQSQGYSLKNLFVMDGSRRSTKANAFFSGLGKSKTIVLFDTLIEQMDNDEIVAVLAHEIGHYKLRHSLVMFIASNIQTLAILALFGWALNYPTLSRALGADTGKFHLSAIAFFILLTPLSLLLGLLANSISRKNELAADVFSVNTYKKAPMASALKKLASNNLTNLSPHPLYVAFEYSHHRCIKDCVTSLISNDPECISLKTLVPTNFVRQINALALVLTERELKWHLTRLQRQFQNPSF